MSISLTDISAITKVNYGPEIKDQTNQSCVAYNRLNKRKVHGTGRNLQTEVPLFFAHNEGVGHRHQSSTVGQSFLYASGDVSGQAQAASADKATAYAGAFDNEIRGMMESIKLELNRIVWGNGSGEMGRFSIAANGGLGAAVAAGAAVTVSSTATLAIGMRIH